MSAQIEVQLTRKRCACCRETKTVGEFYSSRRNRDGLTSWCRRCTKARAARSRQELGRSKSEFGPAHRAKWAEIARQNAAERDA